LPLAPPLRLYVLDTGRIDCADYAMFSPNAGPSQRQLMSVCSYLIVHPDGILLWDTGIDDTIASEADGRLVAPAIRFTVPRTLSHQLEEIGVLPDAIDIVAFSHLHIDHVGNAGLFDRARIVMQRQELDAAYGPDAEQLTYTPEAYAAIDRSAIEVVDGEHDVFGDGAVTMLPLPGHTPGHQGLRLVLEQSGPILLAGDVAYSRHDYQQGRPRTHDVDPEQTRASIAAAKALEREGTTVWLHHDLDVQRAIPHAPAHHA
jgi:N-acyl homoserine lactone hydrolase